MPKSPLDAHSATPQELRERIAAERRATPFLVYRDGDDEQVILDLGTPAGDRVTIGRRPGNEVRVDWDPEVSRTHAALERIGGDWVVVDDGLSHNGTYVNGDRVTTRRRLHDGDTITIGATAIAFCAPVGQGSSSTVTAIGPHVGALLTQAQRRVLVALCRPYRDASYATPATNQQIADELFVSVDTVKSTLRGLFEVYGVDHLPQNQKRASLAAAAMRSGVISRREL